MESESIVRKEAEEFYEYEIDNSSRIHAHEDFNELRKRLNYFYSPESKAIFLDQIEILQTSGLQKHRNEAHDGQSSPTCHFEIKTEKLLFYVKQELNTLPIIAHQRYKSKDKVLRNKVFISYSHSDKDFLNDIQRHYKPFLSQIDYWDDTKIEPGQKWKEEIRLAIAKTKVAVLLVSTDFLGSDFIATNELPPLLTAAEREGAVILIVIVKPCLFEEFEELNQFQAMNPPNRPVSRMSMDEKEELLVNLVRQTKKIMNNQ